MSKTPTSCSGVSSGPLPLGSRNCKCTSGAAAWASSKATTALAAARVSFLTARGTRIAGGGVGSDERISSYSVGGARCSSAQPPSSRGWLALSSCAHHDSATWLSRRQGIDAVNFSRKKSGWKTQPMALVGSPDDKWYRSIHLQPSCAHQCERRTGRHAQCVRARSSGSEACPAVGIRLVHSSNRALEAPAQDPKLSERRSAVER